MAVKKKATKRKTGAKKRKSRVGAASPQTIVVGGKRYTKKMCSLTKTEAKKKQAAHKAKGTQKGALVRPNTAGKGFCLFTRG